MSLPFLRSLLVVCHIVISKDMLFSADSSICEQFFFQSHSMYHGYWKLELGKHWITFIRSIVTLTSSSIFNVDVLCGLLLPCITYADIVRPLGWRSGDLFSQSYQIWHIEKSLFPLQDMQPKIILKIHISTRYSHVCYFYRFCCIAWQEYLFTWLTFLSCNICLYWWYHML